MSSQSQSDILTPDMQQFLYSNIDMDEVANLLSNEETINIANVIDENDLYDVKKSITPIVPPNILTNEEYAGPYEFEVDIHPNGSKNAWVYSALLNKVYMNMLCPFPVDFKINNRHPAEALFIRITPVYSSPQFAQEFVCRCINHQFHQKNSDPNGMAHMRQHVIRCANQEALYLGDIEKNERLNIRIPFSQPQTGTDSVREMFEFVCKNSCPTPGMNRRAIEVIFTLEDIIGSVKGRRVLQVRVCSCPKRDKEKDEKEYDNGNNPLPRGKKRKVEKLERKVPVTHEEHKEYVLKIPIYGKQNALQLLKLSHDLMAGAILKNENKVIETQYRKCLNDINEITKEFQAQN